jgi:hypothetical protein
MEFVEAVRLIYNMASSMELFVDENPPNEQARCESEAPDLICEWLAAQRSG